MNAVRDNLTFLKGALDVLTNATAADTGTTMYLGVTRANATDPGLRLYHSGAATYPRYQVDAAGTTSWGVGTSAVDTNLYRFTGATLATDNQFVIKYVGAGARQLQITDTTAGAGILFGDDTSLFRYSAGQLRTGGDLDIVGSLFFGTGADTNLYRSATSLLKTDDSLEVAARFTCGEQAIMVKAGVPSDADFGTDASGNICLDTTNSRIYFRVGATWKYAALT